MSRCHSKPPPTLEIHLDDEEEPSFDDDFSTTRTLPPPMDREPSGNSYLVLLFGGNVGQVFTLSRDAPVTIGRDSGCAIQIPERSVSRLHVTITPRGGQFTLRDNSRNGTFINNERVAGTRTLENDDWIKIGRNTLLKFVDGADPEADYVMTMYNAAMTDPLTGVFNRRYLEEQLLKEASFAKRHDTPLSVAMLDLDNFKEVNDILGHQAGDAVLTEFAALVKRSIRTEDTMGRYGGEEFLVICRTDVRGALAEAERIRASTEAFLFLTETDQIRRTVSIGVAGFDTRRQTVEELLARADQAMYRAKSLGRNRVCACDDERH